MLHVACVERVSYKARYTKQGPSRIWYKWNLESCTNRLKDFIPEIGDDRTKEADMKPVTNIAMASKAFARN
ncbi:hypothetical protein NDU88_002952 [Pleurodeles waltl]|uniref:Uncharacterized protein n=1 Tax=Pleurodeles waltl TaxID=8319 RepID=A0AAV7LK80_PLEWA|nr:hypothetical protein NDU88_002952 [Pleurodeles waltl]